MQFFGYAGNLLLVDLSTKSIEKKPLDPGFLDTYVGGLGACARLAYDYIPPEVEPLSAENAIIFGTGPFTGSIVPSSSKIPMMTKFPTTGIIESGSVGSAFGPNLKWAGYDFLVIKGKSKKPVYLSIDDDEVSLKDASHLWGKDIYDTTEKLWDDYGEEYSVLTTGAAGENLVKISIALVDKMSTIGKGGLGALMGFKKLKAIVVRGRKGFSVKDSKKYNEIAMGLIKKIKENPNHPWFIKMGRMSRYENWAEVLGWPHKNVRETCPKAITDLFRPERYVKEALKERMACPSCVVGCKDHMYIKEGEHKGVEPFVSSLYGRIMNWGSRCMVGGYANAMKCQDLCNRSGLCIHSFTALMDWAVDLYEKGVITKADTGGLELSRSYECTVDLMDKTTNLKGFGKVLAEGWLGAIKKIGKNSEKYAIQVKGVEPLFDPRLHRLGTVEFYQIVNPRGGWGARGRSASYIQKDRPIEEFVKWCEENGVPKEAMKRIFAVKNKFNVGRLTKYAEDSCYLADTLGSPCMEGRVRNYFTIDVYRKLYEASTGKKRTNTEIQAMGERAYIMSKVLNTRLGFGRKDDKVPERWFEPIIKNGKPQPLEDYYGVPLTPADMEKLIDDYYDERGYDNKKGIPSKTLLKRLNLDSFSADMR